MTDLRYTREDRKTFRTLSTNELRELMAEQYALWALYEGDGSNKQWMHQSNAKDLEALIDGRTTEYFDTNCFGERV